jgi:hypothetical protein
VSSVYGFIAFLLVDVWQAASTVLASGLDHIAAMFV